MLSYEDIFARHRTRPLSYLTGGLDSPPVPRRRTQVLCFSTALPVRRPRPVTLSTLDNIPRYIPTSSLDRSPKHTPSFDSNARHISTSPVDSKPRHILPSLDYKPKNLASSFDSNNRYVSTSLLDRTPKHYNDNYRLASAFTDRHLSRREVPLCTPEDLLDIIREPAGYYELPTDPWNEVYPGIYLSDAPTALCTSVLKRIGITHVLNAAQGKEKGCGQVNTWSGFYSQSGIKFLGVPAFDNIVFKLYPYFEEAAQFIEDGLMSKGKVLVHCRAGISRSATLVCAFLMLKKGLTAQLAVKTVRKNRAIIPNDGFLQQLCDLNDRLKRKPKL